ncbi:MAG TPA: hypothetical protein VIM14_11695 [Polyangia bacterium]
MAILWPSIPSDDVTQALTLLRGELLSVGLEVTMSDRAIARGVGESDSVAWLEALAAQGASAVIDPVGNDGLEAVDVWVLKTHPQRFEVIRVAVEPNAPRQAEMLALRAVEALRAGLLQIDWAERRRRYEPNARPAVAEVSTGEVHEPASRSERVGIEVGAAAIMSLDGLGPAVLPTLRVGWAARPWLVLQASAAGLGSRSTVATTAGNARVAQQYAVLGGFYRLRPTHRLWPFFGLAAGALRTSVEGQAGQGTGGLTAERWSGLIDVSLGAGLRLYGRSYLTLAAHAQVAEPYVAIHIVDTVGATSGRPNLLLTLTVGAWL